MPERGFYGATRLEGSTADYQTLVDAPTVGWAANLGNAQVTLGGNRTIANATGLLPGRRYFLLVRQDATGGRTMTWGSNYAFTSGLYPTLSLGALAVDLFSFVSDGTNLYCTGTALQQLFSPGSPATIPNLALWLKADAITSHVDGDAIGTWADQSGTSHDATQATGTKQPLYKTNQINGLPALLFDTVDDGYITTLSQTASTYSLFMVHKPQSTSGSHRCVQGSNNFIFGTNGAAHRLYTGSDIATGTFTIGASYCLGGVVTGTGSTLYLNGTIIGTSGGTGAPGTVSLGAVGAFAEPAYSYIAEVLFYSRSLTSVEVAAVIAYLRNKYAI